jgi:diguanylate cyclase (GGDEF)-like protein
MVDIDHFKSINDRYGHAVGDEAIREVARRLSACLRERDVICRYGGEEFAVLLVDASPEEAERVAHRLHAAVAATPLMTVDGPVPMTVSVGLARPPDVARDVQVLLGQADEALYAAKGAGRNRVVTG